MCLCKPFQHTRIHTAILLSYIWEDWETKCLPFPCNYYRNNTICKLLSGRDNGLTSSNHAGVIYNSTRAAEVPLLLKTHWNSKWAPYSSSLCVTLSVCLPHSFSMSVSLNIFLSELDNSTHLKFTTYSHYWRAWESSLAATLRNNIFKSKWRFGNGTNVTPSGRRRAEGVKVTKKPVWSSS